MFIKLKLKLYVYEFGYNVVIVKGYIILFVLGDDEKYFSKYLVRYVV